MLHDCVADVSCHDRLLDLRAFDLKPELSPVILARNILALGIPKLTYLRVPVVSQRWPENQAEDSAEEQRFKVALPDSDNIDVYLSRTLKSLSIVPKGVRPLFDPDDTRFDW